MTTPPDGTNKTHNLSPRVTAEVPGLQHERTALAWERTAVSTIVASVLLARYASEHSRWLLASLGLAFTVAGAAALVWAGIHYDSLHSPDTDGPETVHPLAARLMGLVAIAVCGTGLVLGVALFLERSS